MSLRRKVAAGVAAAVMAFSLTACGGDDDTIKVGTTDQGQKQWQVFEEKAQEEGLNVELVPFGDYSLPNRALADGEIDVNNFQHLMFLADYNVNNDSNLVPIGATEIIPLGVYYQDHSEVKDIEEAGEVAIPNDPTNQGRALHVLASAGLVKLKDDKILSPTPADIDEGKSKVKVTPVDAAQTPAAYGEGKPAVINNSFLERAGIDPQSAVAQDDPDSTEAEPYINVWAVRADDADNETLHELAKLWKDQKVTDAVLKSSGDTAVAVDRSQEELQEILDRLEEQV